MTNTEFQPEGRFVSAPTQKWSIWLIVLFQVELALCLALMFILLPLRWVPYFCLLFLLFDCWHCYAIFRRRSSTFLEVDARGISFRTLSSVLLHARAYQMGWGEVESCLYRENDLEFYLDFGLKNGEQTSLDISCLDGQSQIMLSALNFYHATYWQRQDGRTPAPLVNMVAVKKKDRRDKVIGIIVLIVTILLFLLFFVPYFFPGLKN